jgi:cytochrome c peroxidase
VTFRTRLRLCLALLALLAAAAGFAETSPESVRLGLPPAPVATTSAEQIGWTRLGEKLFFDLRLSRNGKVGCVSCHAPERAFSDGMKTSVGVAGRAGTRNSPSLLNVVFATQLFWDGRAASLEEQALQPFASALEHGLGQAGVAVTRVRGLDDYRPLLAAVGIGDDLGAAHLERALATFQRSLVSGGSAFDRYAYGREAGALSAGALRGLELFRGRAGCSTCHTIGEQSATFTDERFHAIGSSISAGQVAAALKRLDAASKDHVGELVLGDPGVAALGRFVVTRDLDDLGRFRTPSLRNVARTAPYMHDGRIATLEEAVEYELYQRGLAVGTPAILTPLERSDLVAFLRALDGVR